MIIAAEKDELIAFDVMKGVFEKAGEPISSLHVLPITHFEIYGEPLVIRRAAEAAVEWFTRHL